MFLISTKSEEAVSRGLWWAYFWWALFGLLLCVAGFLIHDIVSEIFWQERIWVYALAFGGYAFSLMIGWVWMVYNSLINLRQRVKQGWSLIDIQLKRRHDLIPSLVNIVSALKEHERDLQTDVAELRSQAGVTAPGDGRTGPRAVGSRLIAIAEAYPELKTNESFLNLQNNLIDAEQRIALARGYYNDIASFYNTRLEIIPDRLMAKIAGMKPRDLMMAADFERAPVEVKFVD